MNKTQMDAVRIAVTEVFHELTADEVRSLVTSSYAEMREQRLALAAV